MQEPWERNWQDYYKILQIDSDAESEVVEAAYKRLALKYHPDRNPGAGDHQMKDLNKAYEVLREPERRERYHSEWLRRNKKATDSRETYTPPKPPKPEVEPDCIEFKDVSPGETQRASFVIRNIGGPYKKTKIWVSKSVMWIKVVRWGSLDPHQTKECPLLVNITAKGEDWNKSYKAHIYVTLDEEKTQVEVQLQTKQRSGTTSRFRRYIAWGAGIASLFCILMAFVGYVTKEKYQPTAPVVNKGEYYRAILDFDKAIEINPTDAEAYNNRGRAYYSKGEYDRAILDYNKAIELNPRYAEAYYNRGLAYSGKGEYDRAVLNYNKALEINPRLADAYVNQGNAHLGKGDYARAIGDYNKALEIDPGYAEVYYNRAVAYYFKEEYDKAWEDVHKAQGLGYQVPPWFLEALRKASGRQR